METARAVEDEQILRYLTERKRQLEKDKAAIEDLVEEHEDVLGFIDDLPTKVRHPIMVPLGPQAFVPGYLINGNQVLMQMGESLFAKRTVQNSKGTLQKRLNGLLSCTVRGVEAKHSIVKITELLKTVETQMAAIRDAGAPSLFSQKECHGESKTITLDESERKQEKSACPPPALGAVRKTAEGFLEIIEAYHSDDEGESQASAIEAQAPRSGVPNPAVSRPAPQNRRLDAQSAISDVVERQPLEPNLPIGSAEAPVKRSKFRQRLEEQRRNNAR